jgi:hypothetical protein
VAAAVRVVAVVLAGSAEAEISAEAARASVGDLDLRARI